MEVRAVRKVENAGEAEQVCEELRAHGIKCDFTELAPPAEDTSVFGFDALVPGRGEQLYVVVAAEDADRAATILEERGPDGT